ncbi:MAG TPA: 6-carboxytetrahydropterin synthase QueD [Acidobacteriota bacterium]|nr:6-carboxytetrahydropterin synthase QueD [Acidobacteriota bacterium]
MRVKLSKQFHFEASHRLDHLPPEHPCHELHGHSYRVEVEVAGEVSETTGFLIDYHDLKRIVQPVIDRLDHKNLNDVDGLELTSTEYVSRWLWERIKPGLPILSRITVYETATSKCEYEG